MGCGDLQVGAGGFAAALFFAGIICLHGILYLTIWIILAPQSDLFVGKFAPPFYNFFGSLRAILFCCVRL